MRAVLLLLTVLYCRAQDDARRLPPLSHTSASSISSHRGRSQSLSSLVKPEPTLVHHLLRKPIPQVPQGGGNDIEEVWKSATDRSRWEKMNEYVPMRLVPIPDNKSKVNTEEYTAGTVLCPCICCTPCSHLCRALAASMAKGVPENEEELTRARHWYAPCAAALITYTDLSAASAGEPDPFADMIGLGSRSSTASVQSLSHTSRPTTTQGGSLTRQSSWIAREAIEEGESDGEEEEDGMLGWNPFVLST